MSELAIFLIFFLGGGGWLYASVAYSTKPEILLKKPTKILYFTFNKIFNHWFDFIWFIFTLYIGPFVFSCFIFVYSFHGESFSRFCKDSKQLILTISSMYYSKSFYFWGGGFNYFQKRNSGYARKTEKSRE